MQPESLAMDDLPATTAAAAAEAASSQYSNGEDFTYTLDPHATDSWWASASRGVARSERGSAVDGADDSQPLLFVLRVIQQHKIQMFRLDPITFSASRGSLGQGASAVVEQSVAPTENHTCPPYREPIRLAHSSMPFSGIFTDDQNISWDPRTLMAYKQFRPQSPENLRGLIAGLITDLRVLYYPGLRGHPNIIRPLGISWAREEALISEMSSSESGNRKRSWPIVITERSSELSIKELIMSNKYRDPAGPVSLYVKFRLCLDVLRGLKVSRCARLQFSLTQGVTGATSLRHCSLRCQV